LLSAGGLPVDKRADIGVAPARSVRQAYLLKQPVPDRVREKPFDSHRPQAHRDLQIRAAAAAETDRRRCYAGAKLKDRVLVPDRAETRSDNVMPIAQIIKDAVCSGTKLDAVIACSAINQIVAVAVDQQVIPGTAIE